MSQFIIGIIIVIFGVILTTVGGYVAKDGWEKIYHKDNSKKTVNTQQSATGNDNTQAVTTGDNSPIIISDEYVAGNKTVNIIIQDPTLEDKVKRIVNEQKDELLMKYPRGSAVFGVTQKGFIVPKGLVPPDSEIKWDTARILELTENSIKILVPHMIVNTETNKGLRIEGAKVGLPKKVGAKWGLVKLPGLRIQVEIIGIDDQMVIVGIGFIPIRSQENSV